MVDPACPAGSTILSYFTLGNSSTESAKSVQNLIFGLTTGGVLAAATVGFALIRQTENFLNIAHGYVLVLGAYLVVYFVRELNFNIFLAGIISMFAMGILGVIMGAGIFRPVAKQGGNVLLFTSIGMAFIIYGAIIAIFNTQLIPLSINPGKPFRFSVPEFVLLLCLIGGVSASVSWIISDRSRKAEHREAVGQWEKLWSEQRTCWAFYLITLTSLSLFIVAVATNGLGAKPDSLRISPSDLIMTTLPLASILGLRSFLGLTRLGRWMRAAASNPSLASVRGIPVRTVSSVVWFISSALAAMAGTMIAIRSGGILSTAGWANILMILSASVLGGTGSILGTMAAALLLGIVMDMSILWIPGSWPGSYRLIVAFAALILVLVFKPEGLFSTRRRAEQTL